PGRTRRRAPRHRSRHAASGQRARASGRTPARRRLVLVTEPSAPDAAEEPASGVDDLAGDEPVAAGRTIPDRVDPDGPMVRALHAVGVTDAEIESAAAHGLLALLYVERMALPDRFDRALGEVSVETGLSEDLVRQLRRSLGFVEPDQTDRRYGEVDVE